MKKIRIVGGQRLSGTIRISGAKNSAVALIPASILAIGKSKIFNVPEIADADALVEILKLLDVDVNRNQDVMELDTTNVKNVAIPEDLSSKLRASYYFLGAMLGRFKKAEMYFPGGCSIGKRPINLHLKGFEALGAKIHEVDNKYVIEAEELIGNKIYLDFASVGATINIMLAAVYAKGTTVIENAAKEPEIVNVATFLNNMGADISGAGTSTIIIEGVESLNGCFTEVIPDRIEAGTYVLVGALCGKNLKIENIIPEHIKSLTSKLTEMGVKMEIGFDYIDVSAPAKLKSTNIETAVYPGFATDLQQPFMAVLATAIGKSTVIETIYENRFMQIEYLNKMGADIDFSGNKAIVHGVERLYGCDVVATDLRAGACMVIAGLSAEGETVISNVEHILRGYEKIVQKLTDVGANIELIEI